MLAAPFHDTDHVTPLNSILTISSGHYREYAKNTTTDFPFSIKNENSLEKSAVVSASSTLPIVLTFKPPTSLPLVCLLPLENIYLPHSIMFDNPPRVPRSIPIEEA